jgi:hypothetical protein
MAPELLNLTEIGRYVNVIPCSCGAHVLRPLPGEQQPRHLVLDVGGGLFREANFLRRGYGCLDGAEER